MAFIDSKILKQLSVDVGDDMLGTLINIFVSDTQERMKALELQLQEKDLNNLAITAHTLKSVCAQYGATSCSAKAKELELLCRDSNASSSFSKITEDVNSLISDLEKVIEEISSISLS